jgi:hypothetical protein
VFIFRPNSPGGSIYLQTYGLVSVCVSGESKFKEYQDEHGYACWECVYEFTPKLENQGEGFQIELTADEVTLSPGDR